MVEWGYVPAADQNGIILSYTVVYLALPGGSLQIKLVNAPKTTATLMGLKEHTDYRVTVFASTVKGDGNVSEPLNIRTEEDSEFSNRFFPINVFIDSRNTNYDCSFTKGCFPPRVADSRSFFPSPIFCFLKHKSLTA